MRERGQGRTFNRKGSPYFWCAYYLRGKEYRESTGETDEKKAKKFLKGRLKEVGADQIGARTFVGPRQERISTHEILDALEADYKLRGVASPQFRSHLAHIREHFGCVRAVDITSEMVDAYIEQRLAAGAAPATINRATQIFKQAFKLAIQRKRLTNAPIIRHLSEKGNARQGFFSDADFRVVMNNLPPYLQDFALFGYLTGWRRGEIASLCWADVDGDVIRLRPENSKNDEGRTLTLDGELSQLIERRKTARQVKTGDTVMLASLVFHHDGEPIVDFRKAWATACCRAGLGQFVCPHCTNDVDEKAHCAQCSTTWSRDELKYVGRIFHDLRRTAVRNMIRAGVPENVAMSISGHKTRSIFDRYNIVNEHDLREAMQRTQRYLAHVTEGQQGVAIMANNSSRARKK
jgi:integrase